MCIRDRDFIDVGTFGTWGEGHTTSGSCRSYSLEVLKRHIDLHLKNFPDTYVLVNDDMINHMAATNPQAVSYTHLDVYKRQPLM